MLILPAIDLRNGRCVRLTQGDYAREKVYEGDPAKMALAFESSGAQYLHIVDLDGARQGSPANLKALQSICRAVKVPVEFGGGIRSLETARRVLDIGAERVIVGTKLVTDRPLAHSMFDALEERIVAGIDARKGKVAVSGWMETSEMDAGDLAEQLQSDGARRFIVTDIARDGALLGPNFEFLQGFLSRVSVPIIASGGVSSLDDLANLKRLSLEGVIIGKALYEERFDLRAALAV